MDDNSWVFNTNLPATSQQGHIIYDPTKSTTFSKALDGSTFNISYGDGSTASGPVGVDELDIGGATVPAQAIGLPNNVADSFVTDSASNGLVGLAFSQLNTIQPRQQKTFFDNVMADLTQPLFTAQLKAGKVGAYEFGNIDETVFTGQLSTAAVDSSKGFWEVDSASFAVQGVQGTSQINGGKAIVDTGTSLMLVPDQMLVAYWNTVNGAQLSQDAGGIIFPCNAALPDLQVAIGDNHMATVSGNGMNFANVGKDTTSGKQCKFVISAFWGLIIWRWTQPMLTSYVQSALVVCNPTKVSLSPYTAMSSSSPSSSSSTGLAHQLALHHTPRESFIRPVRSFVVGVGWTIIMQRTAWT